MKQIKIRILNYVKSIPQGLSAKIIIHYTFVSHLKLLFNYPVLPPSPLKLLFCFNITDLSKIKIKSRYLLE